ncbi:MAG: hypothetical protein F2774_03940 [Actinobacteria bacterium]|uniref:Unannotated protein n=1 Tax=freshwater metagenome TaxID=449393 RepID=A0A6J7BTT1_9ZZZZ|nr:hypothetical protein [Actinomycetota bacterium]
MAKEYADDDGKLRIFGTTLDEMADNRRKTGETFPSKFTKKTLRQSSIDNLQPTTGKRVDFSDEKMGPKYKRPVKVTKKEVEIEATPEGEYGSTHNIDTTLGPDMGKTFKTTSEPSSDLQENARRSLGFKKGGKVKSKCMASGGKVSQLAKANGIAVRGKSRGRIV